MNLSICSREVAEELLRTGFPANTAVICFYDPEETPPDYTGKAQRVFPVAARDIDLSVLPEFGLTEETYFHEAGELAAFILKAEEDGLDILCQCDYGQGRSAACAAAIREYFCGDGIKIFADYRYYPNQLVYHKVLTALRMKDDRADDGEGPKAYQRDRRYRRKMACKHKKRKRGTQRYSRYRWQSKHHSSRTTFWKKVSNRKIRAAKGGQKKSNIHHRLFDFWWELD